MKRKAVGIILQDEDNKILLVKKIKVCDTIDANIDIPGEWDFIKGEIKPEESLEDTVKRELYEEVNILNYKILKIYDEKICYENQEITMCLVRQLGYIDDVKVNDSDIDDFKFLDKDDVIDELHHQESQQFYEKYILKYEQYKNMGLSMFNSLIISLSIIIGINFNNNLLGSITLILLLLLIGYPIFLNSKVAMYLTKYDIESKHIRLITLISNIIVWISFVYIIVF